MKGFTLSAVLLLLAILVAAPWWLPQVLNEFWLVILTEVLIWSLLAASVNLLFGYVGLLSFGQALYFGAGMYGVALGVSALGLSLWPAFGFGIAVGVALAALAAVLAVRLTWHYFAIITVVFSLIFYFLALSLKPITGGDDGLVFSPSPLLSWGEWEFTVFDPQVMYFFVLGWVVLCFYLQHRLLQSALGRAFVAVRENDTRATLIGLDVYRIRLAAFVAAGFLAASSGALFALFGSYASASYMFYHVSGEAVVWTILGGTGTLLGPALGTLVLIVLREELSSFWEHYLFLVGAVVVVMVTFFPRGLAGLWLDATARLTRRITSNPVDPTKERAALGERDYGR
ncbi:MAG: branched-chain amino acid ABC transporter permease [Candidatus Competibacterales bacterium]